MIRGILIYLWTFCIFKYIYNEHVFFNDEPNIKFTKTQ